MNAPAGYRLPPQAYNATGAGATASTARRGDFNLTLNGYRGLCALAVFVYHFGSAGVMPWPSGSAFADGAQFLWSSLRYGVEMFFMISGFVILGSLLRHPSVAGFLQDRCVRIFSAWLPAFIVVALVCLALRWKMFDNVTVAEGAGILAANLVLLPPLLPIPAVHPGSWSLTYEWVFYLTAAFGAVLYRRTDASMAARLVCVLAGGLFICLYPRGTFFVTGVLVFHYRDWFAQHRRWLAFPLGSLLVFLIAWRSTGIERAELTDTWLQLIVDGHWLAGLIAFIASLHMFASVCLNATRETNFLNGAVFQFLGNISYSFYLWHTLVMSVVKRVVTPYVTPYVGSAAGYAVFGIASLAIAVLLSWASWQLFEVRVAKRVRRALHERRTIGGHVHAR